MVQPIAIFIDGAYLTNVLRNEFNHARIDFEALSKAIVGESELLRTYYYDCLPYLSNPPTPDERDRFNAIRRFHDALRLLPRYEVRLGQLEYRGLDLDGRPRFEQKRVDIMLGVDLVQLSARRHIKQAIVVAGDSDFIPAISAAKSEGVTVSLIHGDEVHGDLRREVDERTRFTQEFVDSVAFA